MINNNVNFESIANQEGYNTGDINLNGFFADVHHLIRRKFSTILIGEIKQHEQVLMVPIFEYIMDIVSRDTNTKLINRKGRDSRSIKINKVCCQSANDIELIINSLESITAEVRNSLLL